MASSVDPDQTAPIGAVCSGSTLFASILNSSVMLGNHLQQTTSADDIFRCIFFLGALRVKHNSTDCLECLFCEDAVGTKYTTEQFYCQQYYLPHCPSDVHFLSTVKCSDKVTFS